MSANQKCTSSPIDRRQILVDAHRDYRHVFHDLGNATRRLARMARSLDRLSEGEKLPYLAQIADQREAIHRAFRSMVFTLLRVFPKWVRTQPDGTKEERL